MSKAPTYLTITLSTFNLINLMKYLCIFFISTCLLFSAKAQTHFGNNAGTQGPGHSFFGESAGAVNHFIYGKRNSFFGAQAGLSNTNGSGNSFFGSQAGRNNTLGNSNLFLGESTGRHNVTGNQNTFLGTRSGFYNTQGSDNTFAGYIAGFDNQTGHRNIAIGAAANVNNASGSNNTMVGNHTGVLNAGSGNVFLGNKAGNSETGSNKLYIQNNNANVPLIYGDFASNGVGINTKQLSQGLTFYALSVNGKVRATKIKVYTGWADYVFEKGYKLRSLPEVEAYIQQHKHLPDVPSAKKVAKEGILAGKMSATLLRKIEELTLYMIASDEASQKLQKRTQKLRKTFQKLQKEVQLLEKQNQLLKNKLN